jgi:NADH-quinone oxidoreductase subunit M
MTSFLIWLALSTGALTALAVGRIADPRRARSVAVGGSVVVTLAALAASLREILVRPEAVPFALDLKLDWQLDVDGLSAPLFPFVGVLLTAILAGTPTRFLDRGTIARQVFTAVTFLLLLAARSPEVLALAWVLSSVPTVIELRRLDRGGAFVAYRLASTLLVASGIVLATGSAPLHEIAGAMVLLGVLVREGVFPFHAWVPRLYERVPLGSALLFVQPQIGAYVLARLVVAGPLHAPALLLDVLGIVSVLYGALLVFAQRSTRRALGYLTVSQSALVLLGLADGGLLGASGAVLVILAIGTAQTGFGLALWALEARRGALRIDVESGGHDATPGLASAMLLLGLAGVGLPGTLAFVAEDLVFHATLEHRPWVGVAIVLATAVNGMNVIRIVFRLFGGVRRRSGEVDLTLRERVVFGVLSAVLLGLGLYPQPLLSQARSAMSELGVPAISTDRH